MNNNIDTEIINFERKIINKNINEKDIKQLMNELYKLKKMYITEKLSLENKYKNVSKDENMLSLSLYQNNSLNNNNIKLLNAIENYLHYKINEIESRKRHILTLTNLIFLPLGIIVGYFGMNFKSMGNKGIRNGILSIKYANIFTIILFLISTIFVISMYYYYFFMKKL